MLFRLIPFRGGKPARFQFTNVRLKPGKSLKVENGGFGGPRALFKAADDQVVLHVKRGEVTLNGERVTDPQPLANGDLVALRDRNGGMFMKEHFWDEAPTWHKGVTEVMYEFESDLKLAKLTRLKDEAARGIRRSPPSATALEEAGFAVDPGGIKLLVVAGKGGRRKEQFIPWADLDAVKFESGHEPVDYGSDVLDAVAHGVEQGMREAALHAADQDQPNTDPVFRAQGGYLIRFQRRGRDVEFSAATREHSALLAQAIECCAPVDLTWFGEVRPEERIIAPLE